MNENIEILNQTRSREVSHVHGWGGSGDFGPVVLLQGQNFTFVSFGGFVGVGALLGLINVWFYLGGYQILPSHVHSHQLALALAFGAPLSAYIMTRLLDLKSWLSGEKTFGEFIRTVSFGLWGGLFGGIFILVSFAYLTGTPFHHLLDAFAVGIPLAQIFGRFGCLNYGCCHGSRCRSEKLPGIRYFDPQTKVLRFDAELRGEKLHPTQIYSVLANIAIYVLMLSLWVLWDSRPVGSLAGLYFTLYGIKRLLVEILRGEFPRVYWSGLTVWQWCSLVFVCGGIALLYHVLKQPDINQLFNMELATSSVSSSLLVLLVASLILSIAYGLHGKKIGSWG